MKNESYWAQWDTKSFQNIKLVSLYSKSVSRENSKYLHFASVQMRHIVQTIYPECMGLCYSKLDLYLETLHLNGRPTMNGVFRENLELLWLTDFE